MDPTGFDDLARSLVRPASRRRTIGVLLGGTLASLGLSADAAKRKGKHRHRVQRASSNNDCTKFCQQVFGKGKAAGKCTSDAGRNRGLCAQCGSTPPNQICCTRTADGTCDPSQPATCCTSPDTCGGGGTPNVCGCTGHLQPCTSADQCCSSDHTACAPNNVIIGTNVCCSTLGGTCTTGGPSGDCCGVNVPSGQDYAYCSPNGACGGPGAVCRFNEACVSGQCCKANPNDDSGTCSGPDGCCKAHLQPCTSADQCCATDHTACAPNNVVIGQDVCCSTLGGTCTTGGPSGDCCQAPVPGGIDYAYCSPAPGGTCGGQGATCRFNEVCVSGVCCKNPPTADSGTCAGPNGC